MHDWTELVVAFVFLLGTRLGEFHGQNVKHRSGKVYWLYAMRTGLLVGPDGHICSFTQFDSRQCLR